MSFSSGSFMIADCKMYITLPMIYNLFDKIRMNNKATAKLLRLYYSLPPRKTYLTLFNIARIKVTASALVVEALGLNLPSPYPLIKPASSAIAT